MAVTVSARVYPDHLITVERRQAAVTLGPSQPTWIMSPPIGCYRLYLRSQFGIVQPIN